MKNCDFNRDPRCNRSAARNNAFSQWCRFGLRAGVLAQITLLTACTVGTLSINSYYSPLISPETIPYPGDSSIGSSMRIGTFNAQFLVTPAELTQCCTDLTPAERVRLIADRILASDYDVIVIQEAFDDVVQDELSEALKTTYPFFIKYIDQGPITHRAIDPSGEPRRTDRGFRYVTEAELDRMIAARHNVHDLPGVDETRLISGCPCQDSGLMLFSRFPFAPLPSGASPIAPGDLVAMADGVPFADVAFEEHAVCETNSSDCRANKGVALVRILHPDDTTYSVVFTHFEASGGPIAAKVRHLQLILAKTFITTTLNSLATPDQIVFVGDLNINGDASLDWPASVAPRAEWRRHFDHGGTGESMTFFDEMKDTFEWEKYNFAVVDPELRDRGLTSSAMTPNQRLDYIFRNFAPQIVNEPFCTQHTTLAYNLYAHGPGYDTGFGYAGVRTLSDHIGVNADFNRMSRYCGSHMARAINATDFDAALYSTIVIDDAVDTQIEFPGSTQWYLIPDFGTYSVHLSGLAGLRYQVYSSKDTSRPVDNYRGLETKFSVRGSNPVVGRTFVGSDSPLYIKVFHPDRSKTGSYQLVVHRHDCTTPDDMCVLKPNLSLPVNFGSGAVGGVASTLFFRIDTDAPLSALAQSLEFVASETVIAPATAITPVIPARGKYDLTLLATDTSEVGRGDGAIQRLDPSDNHKQYLLIVEKNSATSSDRLHVHWRTNLKVAEFIYLRAILETDDLGGGDEDDDVLFQVFADGVAAYVRPPLLGDFEEDTGHSLVAKLRCPIGYLGTTATDRSGLLIQLEEDDPTHVDFLRGKLPHTFGTTLPANIREVQENGTLATGSEIGGPSGEVFEEDGPGHYVLSYALVHGSHDMDRRTGVRNAGVVVCEENNPKDEDKDGIFDSIDTNVAISNNFSDGAVGLYGNTKGVITNRGDRQWAIRDLTDAGDTLENDGVLVVVGAGALVGRIEIESADGASCTESVFDFPPSTTETQRIVTCN